MSESLCTDCKFCLSVDYGYSNYTVEGTNCSCLIGVNPELTGLEHCDSSVADAFRRAQTCEHFREGVGPTQDVDGEAIAANYIDDPELYVMLCLLWGTPT